MEETTKKSTMALIKSHQYTTNKVPEYTHLDVAKMCVELELPEDWTINIYAANISGKELLKMPTKWEFFLSMGFYNYQHIAKIMRVIEPYLPPITSSNSTGTKSNTSGTNSNTSESKSNESINVTPTGDEDDDIIKITPMGNEDDDIIKK